LYSLQALWGDYFFNPKLKKIVGRKGNVGGKLRPLFVQMALDPIWQMYGASGAHNLVQTHTAGTKTLAEMAAALNVKVGVSMFPQC
jgi:ribosome assembly protein 1